MTEEDDRYCIYCKWSVIDGEEKLVCHKHYTEVSFVDTCENFEEYPMYEEFPELEEFM